MSDEKPERKLSPKDRYLEQMITEENELRGEAEIRDSER
jgi:hypothetical protein